MPAHLTECQIRWVDMDAYRHVNNTVYFRYVEEARIRMLGFPGSAESARPKSPDAEPDDGYVLAVLDMDYRRPLVYRGQRVLVQSWVSRVGRSSIGIDHRIVDSDDAGPDGREYARATSTLVAFARGAERSRPLRSYELGILEGYRDDALAAASGRRR